MQQNVLYHHVHDPARGVYLGRGEQGKELGKAGVKQCGLLVHAIKVKMKGETMKAKKILKKIPRFKNEDKERDFWATHSVTDYFDTSRPINLDLSHLKPSTQPVTVRLPVALVEDLKMLANKHDVPYQSLMKILLARQIAKERKEATL